MMELKEEDKLPFLFRRLGRIKEGTDDDQLTDIFQVCPVQSSVSEIKERFEEGVNLFQQKDFSGSAVVFRECSTQCPQDKPSLVLENRAQHFIACTFLPADWGNALTYHTEFMTQSTLPSVLGGSPSAHPSFSSTMGGNQNLSIMRLVFSAIFHMQKKLGEQDEEAERNAAAEGKGEAGDTTIDVPVGRVTLPPISSSKSVSSVVGDGKEDAKKGKNDKEKEKELITLVLSGFENHNRVSYLTKAYQRFVPNDFLSYLGKDNVQHVDIGDSMMTNITTMFIEIHGFQPKSRVVSDKTLNQLQGMKRFSDPPPISISTSTSTSSNTLKNASLQTPQPLSSSPSARKIGRMASRNTVALRADLFSFQFLNTISQKILPIIRQCDGYVDKFFGNAILALFPSLDAATSAGLQIMAAVKSFESPEDNEEHNPPYAQIGMNSGNVILGTVGDGKRMDGTVIGNTVNVAARMLSLTKIYHAKFITTSKCIAQLGQDKQPQVSSPPTSTYSAPLFPTIPTSTSQPSLSASTPLPITTTTSSSSSSSSSTTTTTTTTTKPQTPPQPKNPGAYKFYNQRCLDTVRVPGKDEAIVIHEIFDNESGVAQIKPIYEAGLNHYHCKRFDEGKKCFEEALTMVPTDVPSQMMLEKCVRFAKDGVSNDWDGVTVISVK